MEEKYVARRPFSIFDRAYVPGEAVEKVDLMRMPGDWRKLERAGLIVKEIDTNG